MTVHRIALTPAQRARDEAARAALAAQADDKELPEGQDWAGSREWKRRARRQQHAAPKPEQPK
jgi:hypothetical protein